MLDVGEWLASCPNHLTPGERAPGTHWMVFMGSRVSLDTVTKREKSLSYFCQEMNPSGQASLNNHHTQ